MRRCRGIWTSICNRRGVGAIAAMMSHLPGIASIASWQVRAHGAAIHSGRKSGNASGAAREFSWRDGLRSRSKFSEKPSWPRAKRSNDAEYLELIPTLAKLDWRAFRMMQIDGDADHPAARANASSSCRALYSQFDPIDPIGTDARCWRRANPMRRARAWSKG